MYLKLIVLFNYFYLSSIFKIMYVATAEAADLLNMTPVRLRKLLLQGRVKGAYKSRNTWLIPLYDGLPIIREGKRGRKGTWNKNKTKPQKTIVHINGNHIKQNVHRTPAEQKPVIAIKGTENKYARRNLEIPYPCRIVYQLEKPLDCGAKVWIEILGEDLIAIQPPANLMTYAEIISEFGLNKAEKVV